MRKRINKELILQLSIIVICILVLITNQSKIFTQAQTNCLGPPLWSNSYPIDYAWRQNAVVSVVIFGPTSPSDFTALDEGIRKWNDHKVANCSNVTITPARTPVPGLEEDIDSLAPPDNTIWVIRDYGEVNPHGEIIPHFELNPNGVG